MSKLSPFLEGVMSLLFLTPSINTAQAKYIQPTKFKEVAIKPKSTESAWIEVGMLMRQTAIADINGLPNEQRQTLEKLL